MNTYAAIWRQHTLPHQSYAVNSIIAHALFYVQYIEEFGIGTVDIFNICRAKGLQPSVFDIDAQHLMVPVYRPMFDEQGNRIPITSAEVKAKASEVGPKSAEVKAKAMEGGQKTAESGVETLEGGPIASEVSVETPEVNPKSAEVGVGTPEISPKSAEVGVEIDFDRLLAAN